jgi:tRNA(Arg) A34 adenosine deaminase TadA
MSNAVAAPTLLERDGKGYDIAVLLASYSGYPIRVGAVAYHNSKRLAGAFNTLRNSSKNSEFGTATYHAEFNCLRMVPDRFLSKTTLYIARLGKGGEDLASRPCSKCRILLANMGVPEVVYRDNEGVLVKEYI